MIGNSDIKDKNDSRKILLALTVLILIFGVSTILIFPSFLEILSSGTSSGLGLKDSAVISFFITLVLLTILTIASGDGLIGEVQFVLTAFFVFFIIIWLMIAWIF
jgi:hypothetical protein